MSDKEITCADLLDEYARALRGSWGGIDGRSEQDSLNALSARFRMFGNDLLSQSTVEELRGTLGVCPYGWGHWTEFCDSHCLEPAA